MGNTDSALMAALLNNQDQIDPSPWSGAGASILQSQLPKATNNTEAILGPILQGLIGGGLYGYGQGQTNKASFDAYSQNPIIQSLGGDTNIGPVANGNEYGADLLAEAYGSGEMPTSWTPQQGKADLISALITKNAIDEENNKKDDIKKALALSLMQQDPQAGIAAAKNIGVDFGALPEIQDTAKQLRERQMEEVQQRFEDTEARKKAETSFYGYKYGEGAVKPTSAEAAKVREELANNEELRTRLVALGENIDSNGFTSIIGNNAQLQAALSATVFNASRKQSGTGASLTGPEAKTLTAITPLVAAGDFAGAIKNALLDRSPAQLAKDLVSINEKVEQAKMKKRFGAVPDISDEDALIAARPNPRNFSSGEAYSSAMDAWRAKGGS